MKKIITLSIIAFLVTGYQAEAKKLKAMLAYGSFYAPANGPYVETYLSVVGNSVKFVKNAKGNFQGSIEVNLIFKKGFEIKYADKYNLLSQEVPDTNNIDFNFLDQQRIPLPEGDYSFELSISDNNSAEPPFRTTQPLSVSFPDDKIAISSIELLESFTKSETPGSITKSGFDLVPYVNNFYPNAVSSFRFYAEVYHTKKILQENPFLVTYFIEEYETSRTLENFKVFSKQQPKEVNVLMSEFNIAALPSGNYNFVIEVRSNKNDLLARQKTFFQRSSEVASLPEANLIAADIRNTFVIQLNDSVKLRECIYSFRPISNAFENSFEQNDLKDADLETMQRYVYRFWTTRDPKHAEDAFRSYMDQVALVNNSYKTPIQKGYQTDRGRVYLQYGAPNEIIKEDMEPSTYPYEVWHYYKIEKQSNRKFIFYNTDLVTNDFKLLHSDMPGEVNEPQWQAMLHKRDTQTRDYDTKKVRQGSFGERTDNIGNRPQDK